MKINKQALLMLCIFSCLFFLNNISVKALEEIYLDCDEKVGKGATLTCNLSATSNEETKEISGEITYDKNIFTLEKIEGLSNFESKSNNNLSLTNEKGLKDRFDIAKITFKTKKDATLNVFSIGAKITGTTPENDKTTESKVQIISINNYLSRIAIAGTNLEFKKTKNVYSFETDKASLVINATLEDTSAHFKEGYEPRTVELSYGLNKIDLVVVSQDNEENTYTLNITRKDDRASNNYLSELSVFNQTLIPDFKKDILEYHVKVPKDTKSVEVNATLEDKKASFVKGYGPRTVKLASSQTKILIQVEAENNDIKTYTLYVEKTNQSNDATLKSLTIEEVPFTFDSNKFTYDLKVLYEIKTLSIEAITNDEKAKVTIENNQTLKVGENQVKIKVVSEDKTEQTYILNITRLKDGEILSSNVYLNKIVIIGYNLDFDKDKINYNLKIKNEKSLDITAITEDSTSYVTIYGNESLENGSIIRLVVTGEDTTQKTYTITIEKTSYFPIIVIILSIISVVGLIVYLVIHKKDKEENEDIKEKIEDDLEMPELKNNRIVFEAKSDTQVFEEEEDPIFKDEEPTIEIVKLDTKVEYNDSDDDVELL